ncbi:MAG: response regulator [Bacteroidales bacterium]|nr:response regulator [Bacteroidales bacterium]
MKLLIIDDNAAVRTSLKVVLSDVFDEIMAVGDPTLIPALLRNGDVDAVLLDMNFSTANLDGREGLIWLSKIKESASAPAVVMITAFGDVPLAVEAMKNGAEDFVTKPWDNDRLIETIRRAIIKNKASRRESKILTRASELEEKETHRKMLKLDEVKAEHAREVVKDCGGNLSAAAKRLGINRQTLYNLLK